MPHQPPFLPAQNRRDFLKTLGLVTAAPFVTRGLMAAQAKSTKLRHAAVGVGGMGWRDLTQIADCPGVEIAALCDVDAARLAKAAAAYPEARTYSDWRKMLKEMAGSLDSINVATPDHMHAPIAVSAMNMGLHAYVQKPLAHELHEVRRMTEIARSKNLVTQMGIQIHSNPHYRIAVNTLKTGVIGKITEIHSWCNKTWGDNSPTPDRSDPVPDNLDWDNWLGVAEKRNYIGNSYYHPTNWRKRVDFGCATLGDMACHLLDPIFGGLDFSAPLAVRSDGAPPAAGNWALNGKVTLFFAPTPFTSGKYIPLTWYDGINKPPQKILDLILETDEDKVPGIGTIFVGEKGAMLLPHYSRLTLFPREKFAAFKLRPDRGVNHWKSFTDAALGNGSTSAHFGYSGPLTEAVLLGGVAARFPKTVLKWDSANQTFGNRAADAFIRRPYRQGWEVPGL